MKTNVLWFCLLAAGTVSVGQTADSQEAPGGTTAPADSLSEALPPVARAPHASENELPAADSLRHSAVCLIHSPPDTPARAGRLVVLLSYAARLDPRDGETCRLLAGVYESRNQPALAAQTLENCRGVLERPCYDANCRLLALLLDQRERTEDRISLLQEVLGDEELPPSIRAVAAVNLARLHRGRGDPAEARDTYNRALELDPTNPDAAEGLLAITEDPADDDEVAALGRLLRGNPKAVAVAWDIATLLDSLGLGERALTFFEHARKTAVAAGGKEALSPAFVTEYCNAMLNAEQYERAVDMFKPMLEQFDDHLDLHALLLEAIRNYSQTRQDEAAEILQSMADIYEAREADEGDSALPLAEIAWFTLITRRDPHMALQYAERAAEKDPNNGFVRRVLAASLVRSGEPAEARETLDQLKDRDIYSAVFLAEALFALDERDAAAEALRSVVRRSRSGPAYRQARELAREHDVSLPAAEDADATAEVIDGFDTNVLEMGHSPEKFVSIELDASSEQMPVGEPVTLKATLANIGDRDVTIGDWGLLTPTMSFEVEVGDRRFSRLPLLTWPAPRHLKPGTSVTASVRLDVGELDEMLTNGPLEEITLTVIPTADPIETADGQIRSALPQVTVKPVTIVRASLASAGDGAALQQLMSHSQDRLAEGNVEQRMPIVRQIGSLLTARAISPGEYPALHEQLLAMMEKALVDESPAVRAEMLTSLQHAELDEPLLRRLGGIVNDASPLVRMRMAELLGASGEAQHRPVLRFLARDEHELVREMADLFTDAGN